ncbi:MAG: glycosyltransferase family 4 protein [Deltaproteobacteria bacterium]|nr:glycosyltransferase family 4 protein [Deltaproteobacteria bacterium]
MHSDKQQGIINKIPDKKSQEEKNIIPYKPRRVCMLAYSFYESDGRIRRYAETLAKRGDWVDAVALREEGQSHYELIEGVHVYRIQKRLIDEKGEFSYLLKLIKFFILSMAFITRRHYKNPYDLIHVHSVPDFEVFTTLFPKLLGAKVILDIHDIVPEFYASKFNKTSKSLIFKALAGLEKASIAFSDHVIISNHIWEKTLLSRSVSKNRCSVIMNYPDPSVFFRRDKSPKDGRFIIIYPGSLNWHQGLDIAIKAFARIKDQVPSADFYIYGNGPEKNNLIGLVETLGLNNRVFIKDTVPLNQIADIIANADLGIIPKRNNSFGDEAFSTKILEFMSLSIPVLVSETTIDRYYFNDSVSKFFTPDDVNHLSLCMLELINNRDIRRNLTDNALSFVENFNWDRKKSEYLNLVDSLVSDNKKKPPQPHHNPHAK